MNWEAIQGLGEVVSAVAVVISLVYLGRQIRMSNRLGRAEAWRLPTSDLNALDASFAQDANFRDAIFRAAVGHETPEKFSQSEQQLINFYMLSITNLYEQLYREIREGILDSEAIDDFGARTVIENPYYQANWAPVFKATMGASFAQFFENHFQLNQKSGDLHVS